MSSAVPARATMSIGEVLAQLRGEFPDVTVSKIRFLESAGLVEPDRTPAGYRKFAYSDVERLRYVLAAQRDNYLPLRVIRDRLDALESGSEPVDNGHGHRVPRALVPADPAVDHGPARLRLSRDELCEAAGLDRDLLAAVESFGLVGPSGGGHYDDDDLVVARAVAELADFGIEPRHLRAVKAAADREAGLVQQVVAPLIRLRGPAGRGRAEESAREITTALVHLHTALVRTTLRPLLGG